MMPSEGRQTEHTGVEVVAGRDVFCTILSGAGCCLQKAASGFVAAALIHNEVTHEALNGLWLL